MKYVLIKNADGQIKIIDNSTRIGKGKVEREITNGGEHIGFIESRLRARELEIGFNVYTSKRIKELKDKLSKIGNILQNW